MLSFKCRDVGFDCSYELKEEIDDEIINKVKEHGQRDHNLKEEDFSPTLLEKIRGSIQVVK
jgi:predicted small metal-binding protein